ncbi:uncharacterized protein LOC120082935 [Benincasa hispida]|uniref:uncharacterized protein LOC120082935 n=1 Tax=Benincasa hispida TaxID=102211 RepID=UPI0019022855|nr:uncharacterized protein LOC120082935 [Benincasa hispida]
MDALELTYPVDVVVPKLMGPDGSVRTEVTIEEVELCEVDRGSAPSSYSFQHFSSYGSLKAGTSSINDLGSVSLDKILDGAVSKDGEVTSEDFESRTKRSHLSTSSPGVYPRKSLKVSRSSSSTLCSKRPRVVQLDDSLFLNGADDVKDMSDKLGSYLKKCNSHEKTQSLKQKSSLSSKRGDKRNLKVSLKTKFDSLSTHVGNGSAAAGSSFFGLYGLKSDVQDFTKLADDPPLNDLLDGSYDCANLSKDKGKKDTNVNECFLQSIRKACSVLQLPLPVRPQNMAESESWSNSKPSTSVVSSVSSIEERVNFDVKGRTSAAESPSLNKVQDVCSKSEPLTHALGFKLHKPDDMFVKLGLPLPKDLESLLQDAGKSSVSSKNATDLRSAKQQSRRTMLQPFPWSHSFNGHSKANSDSSKFSANRTTCPGRWWRVGNFSNIPSASADCFTKDLESLTFNQSLFPSTLRVVGPDDGGSSVSVNHHQCGWDSLSSATCSKTSSVLVESRGKMNHEAKEHCPRVMAAAQTLFDIATTSALRQSIDGIVRWPKKPSQKSMKARKLKSEETEELYTTPTTHGLWSNNSFKNEGHQTHSSKKPKLGTTTESRRDIAQANCRRGPLNWATPRSSRSSPSKFIKDSVSDAKHSTAGAVKQSSMMPPPATSLLCKASSEGQQKTRKLMLMDWKRGGGAG